MNQGGRGQQQHQHPSSTSSISDTIDLGGGGAPQRPSSVSPTTPGAQHFRSLPNRGRNGVAAAADAANHNGNHVARQLNGACNNNSALAAGDSGCVEDIYAKVQYMPPPEALHLFFVFRLFPYSKWIGRGISFVTEARSSTILQVWER